jgi:hypothetical protein
MKMTIKIRIDNNNEYNMNIAMKKLNEVIEKFKFGQGFGTSGGFTSILRDKEHKMIGTISIKENNQK